MRFVETSQFIDANVMPRELDKCTYLRLGSAAAIAMASQQDFGDLTNPIALLSADGRQLNLIEAGH